MSSRLAVIEKLGPNVPGAIVIAVVAMIDLVVLAVILIHILLAIASPSYAGRMASAKERSFLTSPRGLYIACLLTSNFISALGGVIEVGWIGSQEIVQGSTCTTQAFFFQLGGNAAALWLGVISMSALSTFMYKARSLPTWAALVTIAFLWILMVVFDGAASAIFAGNSNQFFYGIAGLWCWITPSHRLARLFTQFIWMWFWSVVSAVCFTLVYLCVRGNIVVKKDQYGRQIKWSKGYSGSWLSKSEEYEGLVGAVGKTMCWYPISYITLMLPISVSRVSETFGFPVPAYALVFSAVNSLLVGIVNTLIYLALRHSLKRSSSSEDTLRGSYGSYKLGTESFEVPQEKRPSPVNKQPNPYPWTPVPTTKEWVPPSPYSPQVEATSPPSSVVAYAVTSGDDGMSRSSVFSDAPPRQVPVSTKLAQRSRSFHRPMQSISTVTSSATVLDHDSQLTPVAEAETPVEVVKPVLTLPPPALLARRQSNPSPNIITPAELNKLTFVPLSPDGRKDSKRPEMDTSGYTGPRAISPDLNSLVDEKETTLVTVTSGPPPPPRKQKRTLTPSVPVDVDESDMGSFSATPSIEEFDRDETRPMSLGDVTRTPIKRSDSMHSFWAAYDQPSPKTPNVPVPALPKSRDTMGTFWAAYEGSSPKTPDIPMHPDADPLRRDTMRTFWAAYEEPDPRATNMPWGTDAMSVRSDAVKSWKSTARSSRELRHKDSSVSLRPSLSAVGLRAPALPSEDSPPRPPPKDDVSIRSDITKPVSALRPNPMHRRSRSLNPLPTSQPASPGMLRPAASAIARYGSPGLQMREGPSRHTPTASDSTHTSDMSYRPPRSQPGYV